MISLDALMARDGYRCWLCGLPVTRRRASRDHVIPRSKGGKNRASNLRLAHRRCNQRRGNGQPVLRREKSREQVDAEVARDFLACPGVVL
jgi:5-methylcytosine-specific restriction endonuclease McrA